MGKSDVGQLWTGTYKAPLIPPPVAEGSASL